VTSTGDKGFRRLTVVGLGYVGLPTAAIFAGRGLDVLGVDVNPDAVARINRGEVHFVEPDLDTIVSAAVRAGTLRAAAEPAPADAFILAVPTPFKDGHAPDLDQLFAAADGVAPVLAEGSLVVVESTVPVGTTEEVSARLAALRPDLRFPHADGDDADVRIAHSPERVLPGRVVQELTRNDRVIGGVSARCAERAAALYRLAVDGRCLTTAVRTAELVKLAENAYRDVNIAFANELSLVCDRLGIDVWETIELANHHPRVDILQPGPGVGGHCIAVDPWFIVHSAPDDANLIRAARAVNDGKPAYLAGRVLDAVAAIENPVIACLGLAYKADIDDLRESPAVSVVHELARGLTGSGKGEVLAVEPHADALPPVLADLRGVALADLHDALERAHAVVLLTDHQEFKSISRTRLDGKIILDARGIWRGAT